MATPELAARLRAAFAYADMTKAERAEVLGVSQRQVTRILSGEVAVDPYKLPAVAAATGVPESFFEEDWLNGSPSTPERVEALEHQYATLHALVTEAADSREALADALTETNLVLARHTREIAALRADRRRRGQGGGTQR